MKDLIVLCADKKIEASIAGLLVRKALRIEPIEFEIKVHPYRDPGCYNSAAAFLKPLRSSFSHALVVFDKAWDCAPPQDADTMRERVEKDLAADWSDDAGVVVLDPELEAWVWSDSPHVDEILGWKDKTPNLRDWLTAQGLWKSGATKPSDPKSAVERAVREARVRWTAATCKRLAEKVSFKRCEDGSFTRFTTLLSKWFER